MDVVKTCPRSGRMMLRKKKLCMYLVVCSMAAYGFIAYTYQAEGFFPLRPLPDAESEAKRLIKFITHYHLRCNATGGVGNFSYWPICVEKDIGFDLESKDLKTLYSIGSNFDRTVEKSLATNYSFLTYIISHEHVPDSIRDWNNTQIIETSIVPNDYADFSRNTYGQQTINNLLQTSGHEKINLLRIANVASNINIWEILHFMIYDNLLLNVDQLQFAMYIDKLDEDLLYNWYRVMWELFYKQGFRLFHTASHDSLCLQVTMMESCRYYLSWIRNPGAKHFILHPPADMGSRLLEEYRLRQHLSVPQVSCTTAELGQRDSALRFGVDEHTWIMCANVINYKKPCTIVRFRDDNDSRIEKQFLSAGCTVVDLQPIASQTPLTSFYQSHAIRWYKVHEHSGHAEGASLTRSADEVLADLQARGPVTLLELDTPGQEWLVLRSLLNVGLFQNVTQLLVRLEVPGDGLGAHPTELRSAYSDIRRLESQGLRVFHASASADTRVHAHKPSPETCCYRLGLVQERALKHR